MSESQENVEIMSVVPIKQNTCMHNYPSISFEVGLRVRTCELIDTPVGGEVVEGQQKHTRTA